MRSRAAMLDRFLARSLARLHSSGPVLVPEYPLELRPRWGWEDRPAAAAVARQIAAQDGGYEQTIAEACELLGWAQSIPRAQRTPEEPCWENDYWGSVDALVQCSALKHRDPSLYVEIGSGFSTLFARRAIDEFELRTRIVSIDPEPRVGIDAVCDEVIRGGLQNVDSAVFARLVPGDIVLLDGSHVALMNCDATVFVLEVLPQLPAGVLIGIDDVFLPWDYPPTWEGRIYGEQYLIGAQLLGGASGWRIHFPGWWLVECSPFADRFAPLWPVVENRFGRRAVSFWFELT